MRRIKFLFFAAFLAAAPLAHAVPSFSGAVGGCVGLGFDVQTKNMDSSFRAPLAGFAAVQANFTDWCLARGELSVDASNFEFNDIFSSSIAAINLNELSLVFIRRSVSATTFFTGYMGSYEQLGCDTFMTRQFGTAPVCSHLSKSATNLSDGSILANRGAGLSFMVNFDKAPIATGAYIYAGKNKNDDWTLNFDGRFAVSTNLLSVDAVFGIGSPIQDKYNNNDVVLMIDTITLKGGASVLLGSKFTHSLLLQVGVKDISVRGKNAGVTIGDEINFLVEPRIKFKKFRLHFTVFNYDSESLQKLLYLPEEMGLAVSFIRDEIDIKNYSISGGINLIGTLGNMKLLKAFEKNIFDTATFNAYVSPYVIVPVGASANIEGMMQFGVKDISHDLIVDFKLIVGAKKTF